MHGCNGSGLGAQSHSVHFNMDGQIVTKRLASVQTVGPFGSSGAGKGKSSGFGGSGVGGVNGLGLGLGGRGGAPANPFESLYPSGF